MEKTCELCHRAKKVSFFIFSYGLVFESFTRPTALTHYCRQSEWASRNDSVRVNYTKAK